jgi:hypothetical protein
MRVARLAGLLTWLATAESSFDIRGKALEDGSYKFNTNANITTFSDHVVISYPYGVHDYPELELEQRELIKVMWIELVLKHMQEIVASVALEAIDMDMLVRGGLSVGSLFHRGRVVIGEAMIDAYGLENRVAIYPRIAVSPRLYQEIPEDDRRKRLVLDQDGIWHLDYFAPMAQRVDKLHGHASVREWRSASLERIARHERSLLAAGKTGAAAKWTRFGNYFDAATLAVIG